MTVNKELEALRLFTSLQDGYGKAKLDILEQKLKAFDKALEVIKEKGLHYLEVALIRGNLSYDDYVTEMNIKLGVSRRPMIDGKLKTEEEFELLREMLL